MNRPITIAKFVIFEEIFKKATHLGESIAPFVPVAEGRSDDFLSLLSQRVEISSNLKYWLTYSERLKNGLGKPNERAAKLTALVLQELVNSGHPNKTLPYFLVYQGILFNAFQGRCYRYPGANFV